MHVAWVRPSYCHRYCPQSLNKLIAFGPRISVHRWFSMAQLFFPRTLMFFSQWSQHNIKHRTRCVFCFLTLVIDLPPPQYIWMCISLVLLAYLVPTSPPPEVRHGQHFLKKIGSLPRRREVQPPFLSGLATAPRGLLERLAESTSHSSPGCSLPPLSCLIPPPHLP